MSEIVKTGAEHHVRSPETHKEQQEKLGESIKKGAEAKHAHKENLNKIQGDVKEHAISGKEISVGEHEQTQNQSPMAITKEIKAKAYRKTLAEAQRRLPKTERTFSKIIHQPMVESISEVGSKTVARPSGILGGGICAFLGTSVLFYMSKHYGYQFNFLIFLLLFVGGFSFGMILELIFNGLRKVSK